MAKNNVTPAGKNKAAEVVEGIPGFQNEDPVLKDAKFFELEIRMSNYTDVKQKINNSPAAKRLLARGREALPSIITFLEKDSLTVNLADLDIIGLESKIFEEAWSTFFTIYFKKIDSSLVTPNNFLEWKKFISTYGNQTTILEN